MLMSLIEGGSFELLIIFSGLISVEALAGSVLLNNISFVTYMVPLGVSIAASALIGGELGKSNAREARYLYYCTLIIGVVTGVVLSIIVLLFRESVLGLYTDNEEVIKFATPSVIPLALLIFFDSIQASLKGVFRSVGKQDEAALIILFTFGLIQNTLSPLLAFYYELDLVGLWTGCSVSS